MPEPDRIVQITAAAPGWWVLYQDDTGGVPLREPVAVWALVERGPDDHYVTALNIEGEGADGTPVQNAGNYVRVVYDPGYSDYLPHLNNGRSA